MDQETPSDIVPYLQTWLDEDGKALSPATRKDYENSIKNHLIPWFERNPYQIHEIQYDVLCRLLNDLKRSGKVKRTSCTACGGVWFMPTSRTVCIMIPLFPEEGKYGIVDPVIQWLLEERQMKVIRSMPEYHQPIFWWLKYHLRRFSEAMALDRADYVRDQDAFLIRRTFSARQLVDYTKTKRQL